MTVKKADLDALIEAASKISQDLTRIMTAVRAGRPDAEVEISQAIQSVNVLTNHLRVLRRAEAPSPSSFRPLLD